MKLPFRRGDRSVILAPAVSGVIFMVGAEMTGRRLAERALETIPGGFALLRSTVQELVRAGRLGHAARLLCC
jgi:hypothetical protein